MLRVLLLLLPLPLVVVTLLAQPAASPRAVRAAERFFFEQRAYPFGRIPLGARDAALAHARELAGARTGTRLLGAATWRPIGPYNVGGRINSIALHPTDGRTLWIGAADGGVWKSTDRGASWRPVMDDAASLALGALAVDPDDPNVLYAGTGEAAFMLDTYTGAGVYRSTDGGESWLPSGLTTVASFARIVALPGSATVIAAAVRNNGGIYRSTDGGVTWSRRSAVATFDLTVNPTNPREIWAGSVPDGILRSTDGGESFAPHGAGLAPDASPNRLSVQVAPGDPSTLYALSSEWTFDAGDLSRIYRSNDGGTTWELQLDNEPNLLNYFGHFQGSYNNCIAVDPSDPGRAYAGGVILMGTADGGARWIDITGDVHVDIHAIAIDPTDPRRVYVATDGGMYRSDDRGKTFERISRGLAITQFYGMGVDQRQADVTYGGTQDNGTLATTAEEYAVGGPGVISGSDGFHVAVDHESSDIVYVEHPYGEPFQVDLRTKTQRRIVAGLDMQETAWWSAPLVMSPVDSRVLYLGRTRVYRFDARTSRWRPISAPFASPLTAIGVSPVDTAVIYAGAERGELRMSSDGGATWREIWVGRGLPDRTATDIAPSPLDRCTASISYSGYYSGHVFRTTDCGTTWADISARLPDVPVNALVADPLDADVIFAGTDIGVFATIDGGATWAPLGEGMPAVVVADLALHHASRTLRAATHGRSMYELEIGTIPVRRAVVSPAGGDRWLAGTARSIVWTGIDAPVDLEYSLDGVEWRPIASGAIGGAYRWVVPAVASSAARIRIVRNGDGTVEAVGGTFTIEPFRPGYVTAISQKPIVTHGLAFDGEVVWASSEYGDTLLRIDPATLSTIEVVRITGLSERVRLTDIAWHPARGTLFAHGSDDAFPQEPGHGFLFEIDRAGVVVRTLSSPCILPIGLALVDDPIAGPSLLAADLLGDQAWYLVDDETGATIRRIAREDPAELGPMGMSSDAAAGAFWQVIADFDFQAGPRGSTAVRMSLASQSPTCAFQLGTSADSSAVFGYWTWGRLFARGIERDPRDDGLWVTNLDGTIFKVTGCETPAASTVEASDAAGVRIESLVPNPASASAALVVELAGPGSLSIAIVDAGGEVVRTIARSALAAGTHRIALDLAGMHSGIYTLAIDVGGARTTRRLVKID